MKLLGKNNKYLKCSCGERVFFEQSKGVYKCYDCKQSPEGEIVRADKKSYFIFLGSPEHSPFLKVEEDVVWTSHSEAVTGDLAFFYITAPFSSIVAYGFIRDLWLNEDANSKYEGRLMSEILVNNKSLEIPIKKLRSLFPEWKWLRYPRQNTQIPHDLVRPFLELMNINV